MNDENHKIVLSIIIPIYNGEKFLSELLDSLYSQDIGCDKYEIIGIIDGSEDKSLEILKQYNTIYHNMIIVEQKNSGVAVARNKGLSLANGKYIWFVDQDDYIEINVFKGLIAILEKNGLEVLSLGYDCPNEDIHFDKDAIAEFEFKIIGKEHRTKPVVWCFITNRDFLINNSIRFPVGVTPGEDNFWNLMVSVYCKKSWEIDSIIYHWRQNKSSISHTLRSHPEKTAAQQFELFKAYLDFKENARKNQIDMEYIKKAERAANQAAHNTIFYALFAAKNRCEIDDWFLKLNNYKGGVEDEVSLESF